MTTTNQPTPAQAGPELKPCPFCGGPALRDAIGSGKVICGVCLANRPCEEMWNTRAESTQQETLRKVSEALEPLADPKSTDYVGVLPSRRVDKALAALTEMMGRG